MLTRSTHPPFRTRQRLGIAALLLITAVASFLDASSAASSQSPPADGGRDVPRLSGRTLRTYDAPDARQGVAAGADAFVAVDDAALARHDLASGRLLARWAGPPHGAIQHLNSCFMEGARLWCAHSNYPDVPMGSSVEVFDAATLRHLESHSLGLRDEGSLTWFDRYRDGWIAGFSHYDGAGGVGYKNHTYSSIVAFDRDWRRTGGWLLPGSVRARMAPHGASGGAVGPDGWLYLLGHDRAEMYVAARPAMGVSLVHVATIDLEAAGQAFSWAPGGARTVFVIDRGRRVVRTIAIPQVPPPDPSAARSFR